MFSRNKGVSISKYKKKTDIIIAYTGALLIKISKEKLFFAKSTPTVKCSKIITDAIDDATPKPAVPYANRHIGIPIFPVLGKINGGSSLIVSLFKINRKNIPINEKPPITIKA